jgi:methionine-rich copper-binding protein CopC
VRDLAGNAYAGTSTYDFTTVAPADDYPNTTTTTGVVTIGGSASTGVIEVAGDGFAFILALTAWVTYTFTQSSATLGLNTYLQLYSPEASLLASNDNLSGSSTNSQIIFTATTSGTYYLLASASGSSTGSYTLSATITDVIAPSVTTFSPTDGATGVAVANNVVLTFNETIARGTGTITLRSGSATGAIVESFDAASSDRLALLGSTLTIDPTNDLAKDTTYFVTFASGAIRDLAGNAYAGTTSYDFRTAALAQGVTVAGTSGSDVLSGTQNSDVIQGLAGNDTLNGGSNVDTAIVSGLRAAYTVTQTSTGVWSVNGPDGTDTLSNIEYLKFDDQTMRLLPVTGTSVNFLADSPATYMSGIRDFDGYDLGASSGWKWIGAVDVNGDGDIDQIFVNRTNGRFAEVGTAADGKVYFNDYGWAGETRVVGIYIDPLVQSGEVTSGGPNDSQRRFQNDLNIENISRVLGAADYDRDGLQEVYFALTDGTAYLHAYMHADGNIQYANYQSQQQVSDYLANNGWDASTASGWFG